jgi:hypothetical protein
MSQDPLSHALVDGWPALPNSTEQRREIYPYRYVSYQPLRRFDPDGLDDWLLYWPPDAVPTPTGQLTNADLLNTIADSFSFTTGIIVFGNFPFLAPPPLPPFGYIRITGGIRKGACCCRDGQLSWYKETTFAVEGGSSAFPVRPGGNVATPVLDVPRRKCPEQGFRGDIQVGVRGVAGPAIGECAVSLITGRIGCTGSINLNTLASQTWGPNAMAFGRGSGVFAETGCVSSRPMSGRPASVPGAPVPGLPGWRWSGPPGVEYLPVDPGIPVWMK